jgi:hypothetical protein
MLRMLVVACASAAVLAVPAAAAADNGITVRLNGLNSTMGAGGAPDDITATIRNRTKTEYPQVGRAFVVRLDGLNADSVAMWRNGMALNREPIGPGEVRLVDPVGVSLAPEGRPMSVSFSTYQIQFMATAPTGRAQLSFEAFVSDHRLGQASDTVFVKSTGASALPSATPTATASVPAEVVITPTVSLEPLPQDTLASGRSSGIPTIFYGLGAILVSVGGAILWLLFRPPRPAMVDGRGPAPYGPVHSYSPQVPQSHPNPSSSVLYPTAILPPQRDPRRAPPPSDPWGMAIDDST